MIVSEEATNKLIGCALFALKHMDIRKRGAIMCRTRDNGTFEFVDWKADFVDTLKSAGIGIDEEKLKKIKSEK